MTAPALAEALLAYRPFIDPVDIHRVWYLLLVPLALAIALTYKAVRLPDMSTYPRQVFRMTGEIVIAMLALGAASFFIVQHILPVILPMR